MPDWEGDLFVAALRGQRLYRIDLDVAAPGAGTIQLHYPDGGIVDVDVRRSNNDRACWDGPSLTFCAR